ncbi:MAG TPA: hypothetical protein PKB06_05035, partial [Actinotalea sp.]|nr:hypothetical protein [Actinotalea sp.]
MQSERFERPTIRGGGYDLLGRKTARYQLTSAAQTISSGIPRASWAYDTVKKGQLTSATRVAGSASYTTEVTAYDAAYRPLGHKVTLPAGLAAGLATSYTYTI